ncbi:hypothetical protein D0466_19970 [Peribacillus glennii]|uniref:Uncharacterized protein n=1 Tax=Peribacillus glennii TaxID=2303991 RepID=A0A372L6W6_9BACI|nr:hypothetical protein D0466_19970 [Peribacillus glennii]
MVFQWFKWSVLLRTSWNSLYVKKSYINRSNAHRVFCIIFSKDLFKGEKRFSLIIEFEKGCFVGMSLSSNPQPFRDIISCIGGFFVV